MKPMSTKTASGSTRAASQGGTPSTDQKVFVVEIENERHRVHANSRTSAKYRAASAHKEQDPGPDIGRNVGELAGIASIIGSLRNA